MATFQEPGKHRSPAPLLPGSIVAMSSSAFSAFWATMEAPIHERNAEQQLRGFQFSGMVEV